MSYDYDALGRATTTHYPEGVDVSVEYDEVGNVVKRTDGRGYSTVYSYDLLGRIEHSTDPLGFAVAYEYDKVDNMKAFVKKDGARIEFDYDAMNRVKEKRLPDNRVVNWGYDRNSNPLIVIEKDAFMLTYEYDALDRVTVAAAHSGAEEGATHAHAATTTYEWDDESNLTGMTDAAGGVYTYEYDALNRLVGMPVAPVAPAAWEYDALSRVVSFTAPNGVVTSYGWDAASQLLSQSSSVADDVIEQFVYTYDNVGNRKTMLDRDGLHEYDYDELYRLTWATHPVDVQPTNPDEAYQYDKNHNRVAGKNGRAYDEEGAPADVAYEYDAGSRLFEDDLFRYDYDPNGNLKLKVSKTDGGAMAYDYDPEDRLVLVREWRGGDVASEAGGASGTMGAATPSLDATPTLIATYTYDPAGRRIEKQVNGAVTRYAYGGENIVAEYDASGTLIASYVHTPGSIDHPMAMTRAGQTFYYVYDGHGSVIALTNEAGQVVQRYEYDAFGRPTLVLGNLANPFLYTGREYDPETGLYHYRARAYDPETGRFLQQDPVWDYNLYAYTANNPVNNSDPMGNIVGYIPQDGFFTNLANDVKNAVNNALPNAGRATSERAASSAISNAIDADDGGDYSEDISGSSNTGSCQYCHGGPPKSAQRYVPLNEQISGPSIDPEINRKLNKIDPNFYNRPHTEKAGTSDVLTAGLGILVGGAVAAEAVPAELLVAAGAIAGTMILKPGIEWCVENISRVNPWSPLDQFRADKAKRIGPIQNQLPRFQPPSKPPNIDPKYIPPLAKATYDFVNGTINFITESQAAQTAAQNVQKAITGTPNQPFIH